jgi:hypothetical protein
MEVSALMVKGGAMRLFIIVEGGYVQGSMAIQDGMWPVVVQVVWGSTTIVGGVKMQISKNRKVIVRYWIKKNSVHGYHYGDRVELLQQGRKYGHDFCRRCPGCVQTVESYPGWWCLSWDLVYALSKKRPTKYGLIEE